MSDTIHALATAAGRAAVAVVRLSGPQTGTIVGALAGVLPPPRHAGLRRLRSADGELLDRALVLWFPAPASFTGEDQAELHLHGGVAVVEAVMGALTALGSRPALPGEFTRRAFENGRMDLGEAEAIADLVDAETDAQRRQALDQLGGALGRRHEAWRALLIEALAVLEAEIDFPDEDGTEGVAARAAPPLTVLADGLRTALDDVRGERVREGFDIVLYGAVNAGKSSLLNGLLGRDAAIVTEVPGTTRDVIDAPLRLGGYKVLLSDTAGLRDSADPVERIGVERARARVAAADLRLLVVDGSAATVDGPLALELRDGDLLLVNKADRPSGSASAIAERLAGDRRLEVLRLSAHHAHDLASLRGRLAEIVEGRLSGSEFPAATRARHRAQLGHALSHTERALAALSASPERAAEDVRLAARALDTITGRVGIEDVLDAVFAGFCIGK